MRAGFHSLCTQSGGNRPEGFAMPVLAATATGKIVEGIVPPIKVGLLVQHLVAEPYIVGLSRHQVMDASEPPF
jgi:hypothetical protein